MRGVNVEDCATPPYPFGQTAPLSAQALVARLLDLAGEADRAGRPHVAGLLVGAVYAMCDARRARAAPAGQQLM